MYSFQQLFAFKDAAMIHIKSYKKRVHV